LKRARADRKIASIPRYLNHYNLRRRRAALNKRTQLNASVNNLLRTDS